MEVMNEAFVQQGGEDKQFQREVKKDPQGLEQ